MTASLHELKTGLSALYQNARTEADRCSDEKRQVAAAYARGLGDALDLVRRLFPASADDPVDTGKEHLPQASLKLYQMSPEDVARMEISGCPMEDLVEAAFTFENMLMDLLEDDNTLPFDLYSGLSPGKLEGIVKRATQEICRIRSLAHGR